MKLKPGFIVRKIAGVTIVLSSGDNGNLNQMITLNETGLFIWQLLESETTPEAIAQALIKEYSISQELADSTVSDFLDKLRHYDFITEQQEII